MRENTDQNNSEYGHLLRNEMFLEKDWQDTELKVYLFMVCYKYSQP